VWWLVHTKVSAVRHKTQDEANVLEELNRSFGMSNELIPTIGKLRSLKDDVPATVLQQTVIENAVHDLRVVDA
jgi:hypothetical protein